MPRVTLESGSSLDGFWPVPLPAAAGAPPPAEGPPAAPGLVVSGDFGVGAPAAPRAGVVVRGALRRGAPAAAGRRKRAGFAAGRPRVGPRAPARLVRAPRR